jgi:hypothetical protein
MEAKTNFFPGGGTSLTSKLYDRDIQLQNYRKFLCDHIKYNASLDTRDARWRGRNTACSWGDHFCELAPELHFQLVKFEFEFRLEALESETIVEPSFSLYKAKLRELENARIGLTHAYRDPALKERGKSFDVISGASFEIGHSQLMDIQDEAVDLLLNQIPLSSLRRVELRADVKSELHFREVEFDEGVGVLQRMDLLKENEKNLLRNDYDEGSFFWNKLHKSFLPQSGAIICIGRRNTRNPACCTSQ